MKKIDWVQFGREQKDSDEIMDRIGSEEQTGGGDVDPYNEEGKTEERCNEEGRAEDRCNEKGWGADLIRFAGEARDRALDLLYPANIYCACCGDTIDPDMPYSICSRCVREISWIYTEIPSDGSKGTEPHLFRRGFSCARYESRTKAMLRRFKYGRQPYLRKALSRLMLERIQYEGLCPDLVIPVPMYRNKEKIRGYNQAALLAGEIAEGLSAPYAPGALLRQKKTEAMSALSAEDRRLNLKDAFCVGSKSEMLYGRQILLVDDIMTTGTTADECARVLLEAGAEAVDLLVFASGKTTSVTA